MAFQALDAALAGAFDAMSSGAGRRLTSQFIVGPTLSEALAIGGRRLGGPFSFFCSFLCLIFGFLAYKFIWGEFFFC